MATRAGDLSEDHGWRALCEHCGPIHACQPEADLHSLNVSRRLLEADYGWDIFGFMAEAKRLYRKARSNHCPLLQSVQNQATSLAAEIDFQRID